MSDSIYRASKIKVDGTPGYLAVFRHPCRRDDEGNWGLEIEATLGTGIDDEADELLDQLNELISNRAWWKADQRKNAAERFSIPVVKAFYDDIETVESVDLRERYIPLPTRDDNYAKIMLVGTTGAGKTTLLRHIIGSHPTRDGFPSTSTGRTTTADIEIITSKDEPYEALITFISRRRARAFVDECLAEACLSAAKDETPSQIAKKLLSDPEQLFRLSYLLGTYQDEKEASNQDEWDEVDDGDSLMQDESEALTPDEEERNVGRLRDYIMRIERITKSVESEVSQELGADLSSQRSLGDRSAWLDLFSQILSGEEQFRELSKEIVEDIRERVNVIEAGKFELDSTGWPVMWVFTNDQRDLFLKEVRSFTSIHYRRFGKLLTPLVDGIRVRWRFDSRRNQQFKADKLVIVDGRGLGHDAKSASSISTHVTERFSESDMILLVDNAEQPMQAAPLELLRSVGMSGHTHKLALAFTHFDLVKGPNLRSMTEKRDHVMDSVRNVTSSLHDDLGETVAGALESQVDGRAFFLGELDKSIDAIRSRLFISQLDGLLTVMQDASKPLADIEATPIYSSDGIEESIGVAVKRFKHDWMLKLGTDRQVGVSKVHWAIIKALNRRFAEEWDVEYGNLFPVADLNRELVGAISRWLDQPKVPQMWVMAPSDDEKVEVINKIRQSVLEHVHRFVLNGLAKRELNAWERAYELRGPGSTFARADEIDGIYERVAPGIDPDDGEHAEEFMREMCGIVRKAIEDSGGQFRE